MSDAVLITQMNIPAATEAEFNNWYTNEHVAERVDLPGFKSAFRFVALDGAPKYFAYYETEDLNALTNPTYKAILADQSAWSKKVMAQFEDFGRFCGPLLTRVGRGHGGMALVAQVDGDDSLDGFLTGILDQAIKAPLAVTGYLWRADPEATGDATIAGRRILVLEALEETTLRQVAADHLTPKALADAGAKGQATIGFYRLISFMEDNGG
ncbi:MAG: hypothetical protein ACKVH0_07740 [Alphaproteobacteria bacterium]|jgi:hypothetical protein